MGHSSTEEIVLNMSLANCSFVPGGGGLQRIPISYALTWIKNEIWGGKFGAHLYKSVEEDSKKGTHACPWSFLLSLLPLSPLPQCKESTAMGYGRRREQEEGLGGFTAMSGFAPSPLLGLLSLLGFHNSVPLPIWGAG